jgi:hypothetical protein
LRETYPRWGKDKLVILLRAQGHAASASTVGRILTYSKKHGRLVEPKRRPLRAVTRRPCRPYTMCKPKEYHARRPGDLVQLDTLDIRPLPGLIPKQFTARGVVSRGDVLGAQRTHTEQFYEVTECSWTIEALGYLTPLQCFQPHGIIPKKNPSSSQM